MAGITSGYTAHSITHSRAAEKYSKEPIRKPDWHHEKLNTPHFSTLRSQLRPFFMVIHSLFMLDALIIFNPFVQLNRIMRGRKCTLIYMF